MSWLVLRAVGLPFLFLCSLLALAVVRGRMTSPRREFLVAFWGSVVLLFVDNVVTGAMLWASATTTQMVNDRLLDVIVGACAVLSLALGLTLGWRIRLAGERFLIAVIHPPASLTLRALRGRALFPLLFLWLALVLGAFTATYGLLSAITLAR